MGSEAERQRRWLLTVYICWRRSPGDCRSRTSAERARDRRSSPVERCHRPPPYSRRVAWRTHGIAWPPASEFELGRPHKSPARTIYMQASARQESPTTTSPFKNSPDSVIGSTNVSEKSIGCYRPVFLRKPSSGGTHCRCLRRRRFFL